MMDLLLEPRGSGWRKPRGNALVAQLCQRKLSVFECAAKIASAALVVNSKFFASG